MTTAFSASDFTQSNASGHLCTRAMDSLLYTISGPNVFHRDRAFRDLTPVLEQALSAASLSADPSRCRFCPLSPELIRIADKIQRKLNIMIEDPVLFSSVDQLQNVSNDCRMLNELLKSILNIHESASFSSSSADMFYGAYGVRIKGGNITNVAGSSNSFVFIKREESGISFRYVLVLLLMVFLFFCLL